MARLHALQGFKNPVSSASLESWRGLHQNLETASRGFETARGIAGIANHFFRNEQLGQFSAAMGNVTSGITFLRMGTSILGDLANKEFVETKETIDPVTGKSRSAPKPSIKRIEGSDGKKETRFEGFEEVKEAKSFANLLTDIGRPFVSLSWFDRLGVIDLGKNARERIGAAITGIYTTALTIYAAEGILELWSEWNERSADMTALLRKGKSDKLTDAEQKKLDAHISALYHKGFWFGNGVVDLLNSIAGSLSSVPLLGAIMHFVAGSFWMIGALYILPNNTAHKA